MHKVIYPGSFDPVTFGHLDLINRAVEVFGDLIVAVACNPKKRGTFSFEERLEILREETREIERVEITSFDCLVVDYCRRNGIKTILRGVRTISDFEFEYQMALTNRHLVDKVETVFMMPSVEYGFVSSSLIREVLSFGGDVSDWISPAVTERLKVKLRD